MIDTLPSEVKFYKYMYVHAYAHIQASAESAKEINLRNRKQQNRRNEAMINHDVIKTFRSSTFSLVPSAWQRILDYIILDRV